MRLSAVVISMILLAQPAAASVLISAPEMDMGAGFASLALLAGAAALLRERSRRK